MSRNFGLHHHPHAPSDEWAAVIVGLALVAAGLAIVVMGIAYA